MRFCSAGDSKEVVWSKCVQCLDDSFLKYFGATRSIRRSTHWSRVAQVMGMVEGKEVDGPYIKPPLYSVSYKFTCVWNIDFFALKASHWFWLSTGLGIWNCKIPRTKLLHNISRKTMLGKFWNVIWTCWMRSALVVIYPTELPTLFCNIWAIGNYLYMLRLTDVNDSLTSSINIINFIIYACSISKSTTYNVLQARLDVVLFEIIFPLMCFNDNDQMLWEEDPHEYVRKGYGELWSIYILIVC